MAGPCGCGGVIEGKERVLRTPKWVSGCTFMVVEHIIRIGRTVSGPVSRLTLPRGSGVGHVRLRRRAERAEYNGEGGFSWTRTTTGLLLPCLLPRTSWLSISSTTCCRCKVSRTQSSHNRQQQQPLQLLPPLPRALLKPPIIHNSCSNSRSNSPSFNSFNSFKARYFNNRFFFPSGPFYSITHYPSQIALISGQSPLASIVDSTRPQSHQSEDQHTFTGLQTPGTVTCRIHSFPFSKQKKK